MKDEPNQRHPVTEDSIFHGELRLRQHKQGYRFSEDAIILAAFAVEPGPVVKVMDLGAGCGVVGLSLLHRDRAKRLVSVEIQPRLAALISHNIRVNEMSDRAMVVNGDLQRLPVGPRSLDLIVSNPPHRPRGSGNLPPSEERAIARHELFCSTQSLASEARRTLAPSGRLALLYPVDRLSDVREALLGAGLLPSRFRMIVAAPSRAPTHFLIEAVHGECGGRACLEAPPLITHSEQGGRTPEIEKILAGKW